MKIDWKKVNFRGQEALVCEIGRVNSNRAEAPGGMKLYRLRHTDDDWSEPCTIEPNVTCNHWGIMAVPEELVLTEGTDGDKYIVLTRQERDEIMIAKEQ